MLCKVLHPTSLHLIVANKLFCRTQPCVMSHFAHICELLATCIISLGVFKLAHRRVGQIQLRMMFLNPKSCGPVSVAMSPQPNENKGAFYKCSPELLTKLCHEVSPARNFCFVSFQEASHFGVTLGYLGAFTPCLYPFFSITRAITQSGYWRRA